MADADQLSERELRRAVRDGVSQAGRSLLSTVLWTVLSVLGVLVGLQLIQLAFFSLGAAVSAGFAAAGALVTASSAYLLYDLHWA
jgi:hypothetical protein